MVFTHMRGSEVPSFIDENNNVKRISGLIAEQNISELANAWLEGSDKFLVAVKINTANKIMVFIDGDHGVSIDDCVKLSRYIESKFDRDVEDFELQVSSFGADQPLVMLRQYYKNIGRHIVVTTSDEILIKGKLEECSDKGIVVRTAADKKTKKIEEAVFIAFKEIKQSKIELSFKK
jgi:ribosome maturation factor RimP